MAQKNPTPAKPVTTNNAKPAPAASQAKPAAPLPAAKPAHPHPAPAVAPVAPTIESGDVDLDDEELVEAEVNKDGLDVEYTSAEFNKLPIAKRVGTRLGRSVTRLMAERKKIDKWSGEEVAAVRATLDTTIEALKNAAIEMVKLPDDYKPRVPRGEGSSNVATPLNPGQKIKIVEKRKEEYTGLIDALTGIEVIENRGNKVMAKLPDGTKILLPRGHVAAE